MDSGKVRVGTCILAGDVSTLVPFYRDILGLKTSWDGGSFASFSTKDGELCFFMYSREEFAKSISEAYQPPPKGINQSFEIALWLPTYADVDAEYKRLSALGVSFPTGAPVTYDFGIRNFYVADPEGNLLEIGSLGQE